jgi:hypothetical protein
MLRILPHEEYKAAAELPTMSSTNSCISVVFGSSEQNSVDDTTSRGTEDH